VNGIAALFKVFKDEKEKGQWSGIKFVLNEPIHVTTKVVTADDNGKLIPFKVKGLHRGASVELLLRIEPEYDAKNVRAQFAISEDIPAIWDSYERHHMMGFLPHDETLFLATRKQVASNPSTIRVYLISWGLDSSPDVKALIKSTIQI
jgi:hypothetical protein